MVRSRRRTLILLVAFAILAVGACATTGETSDAADRNRISAEQLQEISNLTALEAVRRLKPHWLRRRGPDSFRGSFPLAVIVDGVRQGGLRVLDAYPCSAIEEIRYLEAHRAAFRFGDQASGGAIIVTTLAD